MSGGGGGSSANVHLNRLLSTPRVWWRSLTTPGRGLSPSSGRAAEVSVLKSPQTRLLVYFLVSVCLVFLGVQTRLANHATTSLLNERHKLNNAAIPRDLLELHSNFSHRKNANFQNVLPDQMARLLDGDSSAEDDGEEDDSRTSTQAPFSPAVSKPQLKRLSPFIGSGPKVANPMPPQPIYTEAEEYELTWNFDMEEKYPPYVGNSKFMQMFPRGEYA